MTSVSSSITTLFQIGDQRVGWAIGFLAQNGQQAGHIRVDIPAALIDLGEANPRSAMRRAMRQL